MQPLPILLFLVFGMVKGEYGSCLDPPGSGLGLVVANALEKLRPSFSTGVPDLGIPPLDPLGPLFPIPFNIDVPGVRLEGSVNQTFIENLAKYVICSLNITVLPKKHFSMEFNLDHFHLHGVYDINGVIASIFPVFGNGNFKLDTYETGMSGSARIFYNLLNGKAHIEDLQFDIYFNTLQMEMECILGCGDMANLVNGVASEVGPSIFYAVWNALNPILESGLENIINDILQNITISDFAHPSERDTVLGNANTYMNLVLLVARNKIKHDGYDPYIMPNVSFSLAYQSRTDLYNGELTGLSSIYRSGTSTMDKVGDWKFLYSNIGFKTITATYDGLAIGSDGNVDNICVTASIDSISIYMEARNNLYDNTLDMDQFIISKFGKITVDIKGLGLNGYLYESIINVVTNSFKTKISEIISEEIKDKVQEALNETPWEDI